MNIISRLLIFGIFVLCAVSAGGQTSTPQEVLNKFLKLDFDGARLDSEGFKKVFPLTDWPDAPGYDSSIIVRSYKVGEPQVQRSQAKIVVTYEVVGMIAGNTAWEAYADNPKSETFKDDVTITYVLVLKNGKWKVHEPNQAPHISIDVALKNEEALLADKSREADEHKAYQNIVDALRKLAERN
jgi:hypothetical protein